MENFYLEQIQKKKEEYPKEYEQVMQSLFGKIMTLDALAKIERKQQIEVMCALEEAIKIERSRIDIEYMARAIQRSKSGIGLTVMTDFTCAFCGETETWGNSNVPHICYPCAEEMAKTMAIQNPRILKSDRDEK